MTSTNPIPVATDQLPAPKEKLELLPSTSGPQHELSSLQTWTERLLFCTQADSPLLPPGSTPSHPPPQHQTPHAQPTSARLATFILNPDNTVSMVLAAPIVPQHLLQAQLHLLLHLLCPGTTQRNSRRRALEDKSGVHKRK